MSREEIYTSLATLAVTLLIGLLGTGLEALGNAKKLPWLVAFGKKLEASGQDLPKLAGKRAPDPQILKDEVAVESLTKAT